MVHPWWTRQDELEFLNPTSEFLEFNRGAAVVSENGLAVVGWVSEADGMSQPFLWTETASKPLGRLANERFFEGSPLNTVGRGVTLAGDIVVGHGFTDELFSEAIHLA